MAESSAGTVWLDVGTVLAPVAQNPATGRPSSSSRGGIVFDHDGALWDATDGLTSREVYALLVDREGKLRRRLTG